MYGFPIHDLPAVDRLAMLDYLPAAKAISRELANGFKPTTSDDIWDHVLDKTGDEKVADEAKLAWQMQEVLTGRDVT